MGNARPVVPRPNFTQNVLRAVRQETQMTGWQVRVGQWLAAWRRPLAGAVATTLLLVTTLVLHQSRVTPAPEVAVNRSSTSAVIDAEMAAIADEDVSAPLASLDHMDALVAMEDTSSLTDTELQFLLY